MEHEIMKDTNILYYKSNFKTTLQLSYNNDAVLDTNKFSQ